MKWLEDRGMKRLTIMLECSRLGRSLSSEPQSSPRKDASLAQSHE